MSSKKSGWKQKLILTAVSCLIIFAFLGLGEVYCRLFTRINFLDNSRGLFTYKKFGESYGNTPNFEGVSFGGTFYTDGEGMRIDPNFKPTASANADALLIMGDSVAFGPAVSDDVTIAGNLRRWLPKTKILNGSAIGYDSFDYRTVTLAHIANHPEVKTVALIICLNDISDASAQMIRSQNGQTSEADTQVASPSIPRRVNDYLRSRSKLFLWLKNVLVDTQMYYFKYDLAGYQKGEQNVADSLRPIVELDRELKARGVALKVFVSPYEAQLRIKPPEDSQLPQQLITSILTKKGVENYDLAPEFLKLASNTNSLFLYGDPMHLSAAGAKVAATAVCAKIGGCTPQ
ncbi:hypothetical protein BH10ACI3_BH10ACI3_28080 [soil metagenome]